MVLSTSPGSSCKQNGKGKKIRWPGSEEFHEFYALVAIRKIVSKNGEANQYP